MRRHAVARNARTLMADSLMEPLEARALLAAVSWDGGAGNALWHSATNWSNDAVPTSIDDVTIDVAASPTIIYNSASGARTVNSLVCNEALDISGGSLTVAGTAQFGAEFTLGGTLTTGGAAHAAGPFALTGTLAGAGDFTITGTGTWSGGTMSGSGRTFVSRLTPALGVHAPTLPHAGEQRNADLDGRAPLDDRGDAAQQRLDGRGDSAGQTLQAFGGGGVNGVVNAGTLTKLGAAWWTCSSAPRPRRWRTRARSSFKGDRSAPVRGGTSSGMITLAATTEFLLGGAHTFTGAGVTGAGRSCSPSTAQPRMARRWARRPGSRSAPARSR